MPHPPIPAGDLPAYLKQHWGLSRGRRRLAELRASGGGPLYHRCGNEVIYRPEDVDAWAERQLGAAWRSTAEEAAHRLVIGLPITEPHE